MKLVAVLLAAIFSVAMTDIPPFSVIKKSAMPMLPIDLSYIPEFASGNLKFTANLYREILKKNPDKNFVFSPFSIEVILALTREGAKGKIAQELTTGLGLPDRERTRYALRQLLPGFKANTDELELLTANKIYLNQKFQILDSFKKIATSSAYEADIETVNFGNKFEAANIINQWVEQQTKNKIKDLIKPDDVNALTTVVLVNCLYFNGKWKLPFDSRSTKPQKFHVTKSQHHEVDMMQVEGPFRYYESLKCDAKFIELPYLGANISMTIALPNDIEGLPRLEADIEEILSAKRNFPYESVVVSLPRFKVESTYGLKTFLENMGLPSLFLNALTEISKEPARVNEVIQKAFINVTESGTEAAAATADWNVGTERSREVQELLPDGSMAPEKDEVLKILAGWNIYNPFYNKWFSNKNDMILK